jgi:hypothetical protein
VVPQRARAGKQEELAEEAAYLRKPTATVWLLNQLARHTSERRRRCSVPARSYAKRRRQRCAVSVRKPLREANDAWRAE